MRPYPSLFLSVISGVILIVSGAIGSSGFIGKAIEFIIAYLDEPIAEILSIVLQVLNFIASLGGVAVIIGGVIIFAGIKMLGKIIIGIGAGMGVIGFLIVVISALIQGWAYTAAFLLLITQSLGWIGIILAIAAILSAR